MTDAPLDPELAQLASRAADSGQVPMTDLSVDQVRARVAQGNGLCAGGPAVGTVDKIAHVLGRAIPVREYGRTDRSRDRVVVYFHGGGWVTGDLDYSDEICRQIAHTARATVISVDYRLAPECAYPAAVDDAWAALSWVAHEYGHQDCLAVAGDSAGGNLAAAVAIRARDSAGPRIDVQLLVYPVTDCDLTRPSYERNANAFPMGAAAMTWFWDKYAPDPARRAEVPASPLRVPDAAGLPAAVVVLAGHDPLNDEGREYADRLSDAAVPVTVVEYPTLGHGFLRLTAACSAASRAREEIALALTTAITEATKQSRATTRGFS